MAEGIPAGSVAPRLLGHAPVSPRPPSTPTAEDQLAASPSLGTVYQKLDDLVQKNLISKSLADKLREKLTDNGHGLMQKVGARDVLAALKSVEDLKAKGFSNEAVKAATAIGFGRGGTKGMQDYISDAANIKPEDFLSYAQTNNAYSIVWLQENFNLFEEEEATFLDITSLTTRVRAAVSSLYGSSLDSAVDPLRQLTNSQITGFEDFLGFISKGEGGYNSMNQGTSGNRIVGSTHNASSILGKNLTDMSIGEVMAHQKSGSLFAAGRYQIIPETMIFAVKAAGLSANDKFSPENQDKLAIALILHKRPKLGEYLLGKHNDLNLAMREAALEWASLPDPATGRSAYGNGNAALHSVAEVAAALRSARVTLANASANNSESQTPSSSPSTAQSATTIARQMPRRGYVLGQHDCSTFTRDVLSRYLGRNLTEAESQQVMIGYNLGSGSPIEAYNRAVGSGDPKVRGAAGWVDDSGFGERKPLKNLTEADFQNGVVAQVHWAKGGGHSGFITRVRKDSQGNVAGFYMLTAHSVADGSGRTGNYEAFISMSEVKGIVTSTLNRRT
jgi:muramidase (phage lysozyme)